MPELAGRSRAEPRRTHKRAAMRLQVQVWPYPPPPSCFRLGEPIPWDLVLSAYAQRLEPGLAGGRSREQTASQGTYRDTAQWGGMVLKSDLMHRHC